MNQGYLWKCTVGVTDSSQTEMGSSSLSNFSSRVESSIETKEVVVYLSLKVLKIRLNKAPRYLQ